jgi:hypothetical protein
MDRSSVNKYSSRNLAIFSVVFSAAGGMDIGWGIQQILHLKLQFSWIDVLYGSAGLCFGVFCAVMLVRRTGAAQVEARNLHA